MEKRFYFALQNLPDFTLTAYQAIKLSNLGSVCEKNIVFLKQLHSLGLVYDMDFHLYYIFDPALPDGARTMIVLMCRTEAPDIDRDGLFNILSSLSIYTCFKFVPLPEGKEIEDADERILAVLNYLKAEHKYSAVSVISKKELFTNAKYSDSSENGMNYYSVSEWSVKKNSRMYNSLKLMAQYRAPTVIRVDLLPARDPNGIIDEINKKGIYANIQAQASFRTSGEAGLPSRDEAASKVASFYDNYFKTMSSSLQFRSFINIFSDTEANCRLLGDVLCSEILEKGLIAQECETGSFPADQKLTAAREIMDGIFENKKVSAMKCLYTVEEIAPFFSFPYLYPGESIGIRKETDPQLMGGGLLLGKDSNGYEVRFPFGAFAKHAYISGVPGSGKTFSMKHLIHQLHTAKIPFLVFEPAKREYRGLYGVSEDNKFPEYGEFAEEEKTDGIMLFSPKSNSLFPLHINPFEIPIGVSVNEYVTVLHNVFSGAFFWPAPTPMILKKAIIRAYRQRGFFGTQVITDEVRERLPFPEMSDLFEAFKWIMDNDSFYMGEAQGNIKGVLESRIGSLMEGDIGEIFNVGRSTLAPEEWNKTSIIIELESLSNEQANFVTLLITSLIRLDLKMHPSLEELPEDDPRRIHGLRHVIFFEEAHNLIGKRTEASESDAESSKIASTKFIKDMLAEVRAYSQGIVIADQLPTALAPEVLKNTSIKIAHRQTAEDERAAIGSVMSADELQLEMLSKFTSGQGLMTFESKDLSKPFYMQIRPHFDFPPSSPTDIELARRFSETGWYRRIIYKQSLEIRYEGLVKMFENASERHENFVSVCGRYVDEAKEVLRQEPANRVISPEQSKHFDVTLHKAGDLLNYLMSIQEAGYGITYVLKIMIDNDIGIPPKNSDYLKKINMIIEIVIQLSNVMRANVLNMEEAIKYYR